MGLTEKQQQNQKETKREGIKNVEQVKEGRVFFFFFLWRFEFIDLIFNNKMVMKQA